MSLYKEARASIDLELAGWQKPCPDEDCSGGVLRGYRPILDEPHKECHGAGLVYVLGDAVRRPCCWSVQFLRKGFVCPTCEGRGWEPSNDLNDWLKAMLETTFTFVVFGPNTLLYDEPDSGAISVKVTLLDKYDTLRIKWGYSKDDVLEAVQGALMAVKGADHV